MLSSRRYQRPERGRGMKAAHQPCSRQPSPPLLLCNPAEESLLVDQDAATDTNDCTGFCQSVSKDPIAAGVSTVGTIENQIAKSSLRPCRTAFCEGLDCKKITRSAIYRCGSFLHGHPV
jgi:hypothetical protein